MNPKALVSRLSINVHIEIYFIMSTSSDYIDVQLVL